jgi:hypothetical protein
MAKRKGKVELIEETLDAEIEVEEQESPEAPAIKSSNHSHSRPTKPQDKDDTLAARSQRTEERTKETTEDRKDYKISFAWRRYVENRFPDTLLWMDRLAQDWRSGGNFEFIDISHPVAKESIPRLDLFC